MRKISRRWMRKFNINSWTGSERKWMRRILENDSYRPMSTGIDIFCRVKKKKSESVAGNEFLTRSDALRITCRPRYYFSSVLLMQCWFRYYAWLRRPYSFMHKLCRRHQKGNMSCKKSPNKIACSAWIIANNVSFCKKAAQFAFISSLHHAYHLSPAAHTAHTARTAHSCRGNMTLFIELDIFVEFNYSKGVINFLVRASHKYELCVCAYCRCDRNVVETRASQWASVKFVAYSSCHKHPIRNTHFGFNMPLGITLTDVPMRSRHEALLHPLHIFFFRSCWCRCCCCCCRRW